MQQSCSSSPLVDTSRARAQCTVLNAPCSMHSAQCTVLNTQCSIHSAQYTVLNTQCSEVDRSITRKRATWIVGTSESSNDGTNRVPSSSSLNLHRNLRTHRITNGSQITIGTGGSKTQFPRMEVEATIENLVCRNTGPLAAYIERPVRPSGSL